MLGACDTIRNSRGGGLLEFPEKIVTKFNVISVTRGDGCPFSRKIAIRNVHLNGPQRRGVWESVRIRVMNMYGST